MVATASDLGSPPTKGDGRSLRPNAAPRILSRTLSGYSRFVTTMKLALPVVALLLVGLVMIWPHIHGKDNRFQIGFSGIEAREATDLNMVNARYLGSDNQGQPFVITADLARNATPSAAQIDLEMPKADITLKDSSWLVLTANTGRYAPAERNLDLSGAVTLFHDAGYEIRTPSARISLATGEANGYEPISGQGPFGNMRAEGFYMSTASGTLVFTGKSHVTFYPGLQGP